uniref:Uncharacterized protein n=1 Tax=Aegilops tauschii subsp. strangulata TaxID=200361 RepID=A0A453T7H5_AEGTS
SPFLWRADTQRQAALLPLCSDPGLRHLHRHRHQQLPKHEPCRFFITATAQPAAHTHTQIEEESGVDVTESCHQLLLCFCLVYTPSRRSHRPIGAKDARAEPWIHAPGHGGGGGGILPRRRRGGGGRGGGGWRWSWKEGGLRRWRRLQCGAAGVRHPAALPDDGGGLLGGDGDGDAAAGDGRGPGARMGRGGCALGPAAVEDQEPARAAVPELAVPRRHLLPPHRPLGVPHLGLREAGVPGRIRHSTSCCKGVRPGGDQVPRRGGGHQLRAGRLQGGHRQDERVEQGGAGAGAAAAGRRVREGQLPVPRRHPAQVRQVGGKDRPAHGQEVSNLPSLHMIRQSIMCLSLSVPHRFE